MNKYLSAVEELMLPAGIHVNGADEVDIHVYDTRFYDHVLRDGSLGLGESYMKGWWDCKALDRFLYQLLNANLEKQIRKSLKLQLQILKARLFNQQSVSKAVRVAKKHYDVGNDLFEHMLDKYMMYSCAYWKDAKTLDEAQEAKLDLICRKLKLVPGMRVLDIGCGWGGFASYAAEKYQVDVTGITISTEQAALAAQRCSKLPVSIKIQDYRSINEKFDRIVSIGMFEHVGYKNYATFMEIVDSCLKPEGLFLLHCIGGNESGVNADPWIDRYIFPGGMIPSVAQIGKSIETHFILQDWHNFGLYYDRTLMEWLKRFKASWSELRHNYSDEFYRMWEYYLCLSAASFRAGKNNLWQMVFTHPDYQKIYEAER